MLLVKAGINVRWALGFNLLSGATAYLGAIGMLLSTEAGQVDTYAAELLALGSVRA